jgi:hypothetical protein
MKTYILYLFIGLCFLSTRSLAQDSKYVVVPIQFDFLKGQDQFRANTLLRYLFRENGYQAFFDVEKLPEDLFQDRCKAIYSDVKKISGGLNVKVQIEIRDCRGELLFLSDIGKSKEKDLNKAYKIAIEAAFESFKSVNVSSQMDELEKLVAEETQRDSIANAASTPQKAVGAGTIANADSEPVITPSVTKDGRETLFAKATDSGIYQVFNTKPEVVMVLEKSDIKDVFKVRGEEGILFKRGDLWIHAKTIDGKTTEKAYYIKF